jgi:hypothetical protein
MAFDLTSNTLFGFGPVSELLGKHLVGLKDVLRLTFEDYVGRDPAVPILVSLHRNKCGFIESKYHNYLITEILGEAGRIEP